MGKTMLDVDELNRIHRCGVAEKEVTILISDGKSYCAQIVGKDDDLLEAAEMTAKGFKSAREYAKDESYYGGY